MRHEIEKLRDEMRTELKDVIEVINGHPELTREHLQWLEGRRRELEHVADKLDAILANPGDDYKRGVVDGMTASANFVADDHLQGRDNDRMRLADSLRDEAKLVEQEK